MDKENVMLDYLPPQKKFYGYRGIYFLIITAFLFQLVIIWARVFCDISILVSWPFFDDSFYAFSVAANIGSGNGITIDGENLTNGFQPLWVFLISPFWLIFRDLVTTLRAVTCASFVIQFFIWLTARRLVIGFLRNNISIWSELSLLLLVLTSYTGFSHIYNGLETGLVILTLLFLIASLLRYHTCPSFLNALLVGLAIGISILARIDSGFAAIGAAISMLFVSRYHGENLKRNIIHVLFAALLALLITLPWWIYNYKIFGNVMPISGSSQMGIRDIGQNIESTLAAMTNNILNTKFLDINKTPVLGRAPNWIKVLVHSSLLMIFLSCIWMNRSAFRRQARYILIPMLFSSLFLALFYMSMFWANHMFNRYAAGLYAMSLIFWPIIIQSLIESRRKYVIVLLGMFVCFIFCLNEGMIISTIIGKGIGRNTMYTEQLDLVQQFLPHGERVGAGQSGTLGYFIPQVINLDGKVNPWAPKMNEDGYSATEYLRSKKVYYFVDWDSYFKMIFSTKERSQWEIVAFKGAFYMYHLKESQH